MKGMITDIQRFSLNDGPGIRTCVFFKGCNMHCQWCHNPETIPYERTLLYYSGRCIHCNKCAGVCPSGANTVLEGRHTFNRTLCIGCMECVRICYPGAFTVSGRLMADTEVMDEIAQDKLFYAQSGGGVTFTGGEVFCQKVFLDSLLDLCRVGGISTAVETNINFLFNEIKAILKKIDVLMVDIKMTDPVKHKTYTLAENNTILENIRRLNGINTKIIVRTPVIPGINDIPEEIIRIAAAAQKLDNLLYYELLNYNPLGHDKYTAMGISRGMLKKKPLSGTAMTALVRAAESTGIKARFA